MKKSRSNGKNNKKKEKNESDFIDLSIQCSVFSIYVYLYVQTPNRWYLLV